MNSSTSAAVQAATSTVSYPTPNRPTASRSGLLGEARGRDPRRQHDHAVRAGELVRGDLGEVPREEVDLDAGADEASRGRCRGTSTVPSGSWKSPVKATRKGFVPWRARPSRPRDAPARPGRPRSRRATAQVRPHRAGRGRRAASDARSDRSSNPASMPRPIARKPCSSRCCTFVVARRHDAAVLPGGAERVLQPQDRVGDARPFPLPAVTRPTPSSPPGRTRTARRPARRSIAGEVLAARHRLDDRHDEDVLVRLGRVLGERLAPRGRPLGADAANALERVAREPHRLLQLLAPSRPTGSRRRRPRCRGRA